MDVLRPTTPREVRDCLLRAAAGGTRLRTYRPDGGERRMDLSGLDGILEIDPANLVAVVRPGVRMDALREALAGQGLRFIPAQSRFLEGMSLGEFFATGAPNLYGLKYGAAKHQLMGSTVVLGSGEELKTGGRTVKNVTGYDLTRFLNAPFAGFGVAVEFILKLLPQAEARHEGAAVFPDAAQAQSFAQDLRRQRLVPAVLLWIDPVARAMAENAPAESGHLVLFELDGSAEEVSLQRGVAENLLRNHGATALDADGCAALQNALRDLFGLDGGQTLFGEYSTRPAVLPELAACVRQWADGSGAELGLFAQAGEGKLALRLRGPVAQNPGLVRDVSALVASRGGFVSGRFGRMMGLEPQGELAQVEKTMKRRFDPAGVLAG